MPRLMGAKQAVILLLPHRVYAILHEHSHIQTHCIPRPVVHKIMFLINPFASFINSLVLTTCKRVGVGHKPWSSATFR